VAVTPDYAGYKEAQERLRNQLGEAVVLLAPLVATYPPGTVIDPESGEPLDPLVKPTASGEASALVKGRVAYTPVRRGGVPQAGATPIGWMSEANIVVILSSGAASAAKGAAAMVVREERYAIRDAQVDGIAGIDRYLLFGQKEGS
jgi:hypothetical protein